MGLGKDPLN